MYREQNPKIKLYQKQAGFSLLEISIVVLVLGIMAIVVIPDSSPTNQQKLDLAAEQIAQALRFAHSEALRTGEHHGVTISQVTQTITVKKWDLTTDPVSTELVPYHPVDKQSFVFDADTMSLAPGVSIINSSDIFNYVTIGRRRSLIFDPEGVPVWVLGSDDSIYRLLDGIVELSNGQNQRNIAVAPLTGRVTVQ
ncbi:MAG: prepilin-type N-terminal cleavage/methylation domain-containing protein [Gammaproteobacteria bacterium]|nr:prepilin-type N-terminal cleavage/methylation domain-containing protein [Gammaproteobacteria bacterium]MDH3858341.1 prepilin-type N-terminal cleavage/methylation domain-containing protein [Gammaproteobacteria bacterium]